MTNKAIENMLFEDIFRTALANNLITASNGFKIMKAQRGSSKYTLYITKNLVIELSLIDFVDQFVISYHDYIFRSGVHKHYATPDHRAVVKEAVSEVFTTRSGYPEWLSNKEYHKTEVNRVFMHLLELLPKDANLVKKMTTSTLIQNSRNPATMKSHIDRFRKIEESYHITNQTAYPYPSGEYRQMLDMMRDLNIEYEEFDIHFVYPTQSSPYAQYYIHKNFIFENYGECDLLVFATNTDDVEKIKRNIKEPLYKSVNKDTLTIIRLSNEHDTMKEAVGELEVMRLVNYPRMQSNGQVSDGLFYWVSTVPEPVEYMKDFFLKIGNRIIAKLEMEIDRQKIQKQEEFSEFSKFIK